MKQYTIKKHSTARWDDAEKAEISSYTWGSDYTPHAYAQMLRLDDGIAVRLTAYECSPKAVYRSYNDPVYKDSCLEFFASFDDSPLYMNFEVNSNGAFLAAVRTERKNKTPIHEIVDISKIPVKVEKTKEFWSVEIFFSDAIIKELFSGYTPNGCYRANFYKCGDETEIPHFGSWSPISLPTPDFHCPQFFGRICISNQ